MKNRVLFQQDLTLLSKSGICPERDYALAYSLALDSARHLEEAMKKGNFSFLRDPFVSWQEESRAAQWLEKFQDVTLLCVVGNQEETRSMRLLASLLHSWVWVPTSRPRFCFLDRLDPEVFWEVLSIANPKTTGLIVLSESGEDPVTLLQMMRILEYWHHMVEPDLLSRHSFVATTSDSTTLGQIARKFNLTRVPYPTHHKGFGCFDANLLLPLAVGGFYCEKFLEGAASVCLQFFKSKWKIPIQGAAIGHIARTFGAKSHEIFGNTPAFDLLAPWVDQISPAGLSAGREFSASSPRLVTALLEQNGPQEHLDPEFWTSIPRVRHLASKSLIHLSRHWHQEACLEKIRQGQFLRVLTIKSLNEETLGALMMNFCLEALLMNLMGARTF